MPQDTPFGKFLKWRARHLSTDQFVLILSVLVGIIGGLAASVLKFVVHGVGSILLTLNEQFSIDYLFLAYPLTGIVLTVLFVKYVNRNKLGHGIPNMLYVIARKAGIFEKDKLYSHIATSALTVGFGGSAGLEAPIVTTGAAYGSTIARLFHLDYRRRILLLGCGVAAALSAVFAAPIAGVIFVFEVLVLDIGISYMIPLLLASVAGMIVGLLTGTAEVIISYSADYSFSLGQVPLYVLLGIFTGIISVLFNKIYFGIENIANKYPRRIPRAVVGGVILGLLLFVYPPLYGEGYAVIRALLSDEANTLVAGTVFEGVVGYAWLLPAYFLSLVVVKIVATSVTISSGGNGGVFAPSLFLGAVAGFLFARLVNLLGWPEPLLESSFALAAMAGFLSGVMHAPLTGIFLIAEVTSGYELIVPLMIVSAISYVSARLFSPYSLNTRRLAETGALITRDKDQMVLRLLKVENVVETDMPLVRPDATLGNLVEVIKHAHRNIFPVVDASGTLRGIILLDDIREVMFNPSMYETTRVTDLMHPPPGYVDINDPMDTVMAKFTDTGAWNLPVVDGQKYVGFLSKARIFNLYRTQLIRQTRE